MTDPVSFYHNFQDDRNSRFIRSYFPLLSVDARSRTQSYMTQEVTSLEATRQAGRRKHPLCQRSTEGSLKAAPGNSRCPVGTMTPWTRLCVYWGQLRLPPIRVPSIQGQDTEHIPWQGRLSPDSLKQRLAHHLSNHVTEHVCHRLNQQSNILKHKALFYTSYFPESTKFQPGISKAQE